MHPKHIRMEDFAYSLPDHRIARHPVSPRDESKLLIVNGNQIQESQYVSLAQQLPQGSALIFNETRVMPARLIFRKHTGKKIEIFCLEPAGSSRTMEEAMNQVGEIEYLCMIGGVAKWKPDQWISLDHEDPELSLQACWRYREQGVFRVHFRWDKPLSFAEVLDRVGKIPIPPYLNREPEHRDHIDYQTLFARYPGSVAAPTAGLHFTPRMMHSLKENKIDSVSVTLHVGAGTFRPVSASSLEGHDMHAEWIEVDLSTLIYIRDRLGETPWIAVGTTAMRLIESLYWIGLKLGAGHSPIGPMPAVGQWDPYEWEPRDSPTLAFTRLIEWMQEQGETRLVTRTQILIAPGYPFQIASGLITNFHQSASTLILLVAALEKRWRSVYDYALDHDFRFLSYGDGCLFLPKSFPKS